MKFLSALLLLTLLFSCHKDQTDDTHCWQLVDQSGNFTDTVCGKTESELNLQACDYFCLDCNETKFCWRVDGQALIAKNQTEKWMDCRFASINKAKVDCDNCDNWFTRRKQTYRALNQTTYSAVLHKAYCGDTALRFKSANTFVLKDDADSLIILQRSLDGISFQ